jgi:hypothetical protein
MSNLVALGTYEIGDVYGETLNYTVYSCGCARFLGRTLEDTKIRQIYHHGGNTLKIYLEAKEAN